MKVAVLSGKGGTGKTFVAVNLAVTAGRAVYIDCDTEEPNGALFLKTEGICTETVATRLPQFDGEKCTVCRKCVDFCRFRALVCVKNRIMLFPEVCHSCGGCELVCPHGAISETEKPIGLVERGRHGEVEVVTGRMNPGEVSGTAIIKAALAHAGGEGELTVIDCPPGSACSVTESVQGADYCLLVAEPTAFGLHNLKMVCELAEVLKKPCGVVINKTNGDYAPLETFCANHNIPVLCRIPYSRRLAELGAAAELAAERDGHTAALFGGLLDEVRRRAER